MWGTTASVSADSLDRRLFESIYAESDRGIVDDALRLVDGFGRNDVVIVSSVFAIVVGEVAEIDELRETGWLLGASFAASATTTYALKRIVRRPRPLNPEDRRSMPSGHATIAFAVATVLADRYPRWRFGFYALAAGTAFARVYFGRHYPSDVLAGAVVGYGTTRLVLGHEATILSIRF